MTTMELGSPVVSPARIRVRHLAVYAAWESEAALDNFLSAGGLGKKLSDGWHVRLEFLRQWGSVVELDNLPPSQPSSPDEPVVALTLARLKHLQLPRFIKWGKPVERLVRDHPGTTFALAAMRPLRTVSTFSIWNSQREMMQMVRGHGNIEQPDRHAKAMVERERKDFHFEFTTLRFRCLSEFGTWEGRNCLVPTTKNM